jgi:ferric-dicitrate binding protein FerR (iron transport regulator)
MTITHEVKAAAADWLIQLETTESIDALWPAFRDWLDRDPDHKVAYLRIERAWHALDGLLSLCSAEESAQADLVFSDDRD